MWKVQYITRATSAGSVRNSQAVAGDFSVHLCDVLRAGGLVPAGMPVADSLLIMFLIAELAISALTRTPLLSDRNCVRISTYVFQLAPSYLLARQAHLCSEVLG